MKLVLKKKIIAILIIFVILMPKTGFCLEKEKERYYVSVKAFNDRFYDAAFSLFQRFINDFPESNNFYKVKLYIARCHYHMKNYSLALEVLAELERKKIRHDFIDQVYYWLAVINFKGKNLEEAKKYAKIIIDDYQGSQLVWRAYYLISDVALEEGDYKNSEAILNKVIKECHDEDVLSAAYSQLLGMYFKTKNNTGVISLAKEYLGLFPKGHSREKAYFYLGESYYLLGDWDRAIESYQSALLTDKKISFSDLCYQGLGLSYLEKGIRSRAKDSLANIKDDELRMFSRGIYYSKIKDYNKALDIFDISFQTYPKGKFVINTYLSKADIYYEMGRINDAVNFYTIILENFDFSQHQDIFNKVHYGLAWCYLKSGKFKKAIEEFKYTLKTEGSKVVRISSQIQIADAYQETGKYEKSLEIYDKILKNNPNTIYADYIQFQIGMSFLKSKNLEKSFLALANLKNKFPHSKLIHQAQYYLAVGYFSKGNYTEAKSLLKVFFDKFNSNELSPEAAYLYGKCFFNQKDYDKALEIFKKVAAKSQSRDMRELALIDIGNVYLSLELFSKAKETWGVFLKQYPESQYAASVALYLGGLYEKELDYTEAARYYENTIRKYKGSLWSDEAKISLGHLYLEKGDMDKAQKYFEDLERKDSVLAPKAKLYLGKIFTEKKRYERALGYYEELIRSNSSVSKIAILDKANLLKKTKDYREAVKFYKLAIENEIDSMKVRFSLAFCLEKSEKFTEAIGEYFNIIYSSDKRLNNGEKIGNNYKIKSYFRIARIYEDLENIEAAKKTYRAIIRMNVDESRIAKKRLYKIIDENE